MINMENDIVNLLNAISLDLALKWTKKVEWKWHWLRKYVKYLQLPPSPLLPWGSISVEPLKKSGRIDSVLRMIQPTALPCPTNALRFGCWLECISYHFALSNEIIFIKCGEQNQLTFAGYGFTPAWLICPALSEYWDSEFWIPYLINHLNCIYYRKPRIPLNDVEPTIV